MRATGAVLPLHIVVGACKQAAAEAVEAHAIDVPIYDSPQLLQWATQLALGPMCERLLRHFEFEALVCWDSWQVTAVCTSRNAQAILAEKCGLPPTGAHVSGAPVFVRVGSWVRVGGERPPAHVRLGPWEQPSGGALCGLLQVRV